MTCSERFSLIELQIPERVKIVAVSKTKPALLIAELYEKTGNKLFGENKVQELLIKQDVLPKDIEWHLIGHLQTNKVKAVVPFVGLIQSVDSEKLLMEINKEAGKIGRVIPCLLQFHIAREEAKFGFLFDEVCRMLDSDIISQLPNISIRGVMGMATFTEEHSLVHSECKQLYKYFEALNSNYFAGRPDFCEISMGMTDDYQIAIEEGSTIVRIGSGIFGDR